MQWYQQLEEEGPGRAAPPRKALEVPPLLELPLLLLQSVAKSSWGARRGSCGRMSRGKAAVQQREEERVAAPWPQREVLLTEKAPTTAAAEGMAGMQLLREAHYFCQMLLLHGCAVAKAAQPLLQQHLQQEQQQQQLELAARHKQLQAAHTLGAPPPPPLRPPCPLLPLLHSSPSMLCLRSQQQREER